MVLLPYLFNCSYNSLNRVIKNPKFGRKFLKRKNFELFFLPSFHFDFEIKEKLC